MDSIRFRRPIRAGCEWLLTASGAWAPSRPSYVGLMVEGHQLSVDGHARLAALLLTRVARHPPTAGEPVTLHRTIEHLKICIDLRPSDPPLRRALMTARLLNGEVEEGLRAADVCKAMAPTVEHEIEVDALRLCLQTDAFEPLRSRYERLAKHPVPDNDRRVACLAAYHRACGHHDDARTMLLEARERWPSSLIVGLDLAETLWASSDRSAALAQFSSMHARHREHPWVEWNLVAALALTGDVKTARDHLQSSTPSVASDAELRALVERSAELHSAGGSPLSGDLSTVSLADVLNLLWNCRSFGTLSIDSTAGVGGLHLWKGRLVGAVSPSFGSRELERVPSPERLLAPMARAGAAVSDGRASLHRQVCGALEEMLTWRGGRFEFRPLSETSFPAAIDELAFDTPVVLLEAYANLDQKRR